MDMNQWFVLMPMSVLGARSNRFIVFMLMVLVVDMFVLMFQRLVLARGSVCDRTLAPALNPGITAPPVTKG